MRINQRKPFLGTCTSLFWLVLFVVMLSLFFISTAPTYASDYPSENFDFICEFSPGGTSDLQARVFEKFWKDTFGVDMKVEYVTGAGGQVGWDTLVKRDPDGYTVAGPHLPHCIMQPIFRDTDYTTQDMVDGAIAQLVTDPQMITVRQDSQYEDINDLIQAAKERPGSITAAVVGKYTGDWLGLKLFEYATDTEFATVIFPGSKKSVAALLGGHVDFMLGNVGDIKTLGPENIRTLLIGAKERPDVIEPYVDQIGAPTAKEKGIDWNAAIHRGIGTVPGTPQDRINYLRENIWNIINKDEYKKSMMEAGLPMNNKKGEEWAQFIKERKKKVINVLKEFGYVKEKDGEIVPTGK